MSALVGCREAAVPLRQPDSVESLCREGSSQRPGPFKLPSIEGLRNDKLVKGQLLHVNMDAVQRTVAAAWRPESTTPVAEETVRKFIVDSGGGVLVHWSPPVSVHVLAVDAKSRPLTTQVYGAGLADAAHVRGGRELYLLEHEQGESTAQWRSFITSDTEHVCQ